MAFAALVILYLWLRPILDTALVISLAVFALSSAGSVWAKRQEKHLTDLDFAQPGSVAPDRLRRVRLGHVALAGIASSSAAIFFVALILHSLSVL